jgi:hypothetical protein
VSRYSVYGLTIDAPLALPAPRAAPGRRPDLILTPTSRVFGPSRPPRSWFRYEPLPDGAAHLDWRGLFSFEVSADGCAVRYRKAPRATRASLGTYLLGHVVSFALVARGQEPLHGTAIDLDGDVIVLLGECGEGKSTLGAGLVARGGRLVTDDLVAIARRGRGYVVQPGPARLKLYRRIARALVPRRAVSAMHRETTKVVVPLEARERAAAPGRLRAFYVIDRRPRRGKDRGVSIEPLSPGEAVVELVRASFNLTVEGPERERRRFALAASLARAVPVRRLRYRRSLALLPAVCDAIVGDLARARRRDST